MPPDLDRWDAKELARRLIDFYRGRRRDLPFRRTRDPYAIWVCEVMAQQTQIATLVPYWERWMRRFPTVRALAEAPLDDVLGAWAGLGYYARARSLHAAARLVVDRHRGRLPADPEALRALPGVGPYTAGAVASIAFGRRAAAVDGNVARVYARLFGIEEDVRAAATQKRLWRLAEALVPEEAPGDFNQALFDLGATICTPRAPACLACPLAERCAARAAGRQEALPVVRRRLAAIEREVHAALIVRAGRWLLCRRVPRGLFGGLWELPALDALQAAGVRVTVDRRRALARHAQKLSHRTLHHTVYRARLAGRTPEDLGPAYDAARFVAPASLGSLGVSSATAAIAAALLENPEWRTPNARSSSSTRATRSSSRA